MSYQQFEAEAIFEFRASHFVLWEKQSLYLRAAADRIYSDLVEINKIIELGIDKARKEDVYTASGLNSLWMLSTGYAIECLMKAIIVSTTSEPILNKRKELNTTIFGNGRKTHDLYYLFNKIDVSHRPIFSEKENSFIVKMSSYITWRGKYPIPLSSKDLLPIYRNSSLDNKIILRDLGAAKLKNDIDNITFKHIFELLYDRLSKAKLCEDVNENITK